MPVAETVVILADCIAAARVPFLDWERSLHAALLELPTFRDAGTIAEWDGLFSDAWAAGAKSVENPEGYFKTSRLFGQAFELGRSNLFTKFNVGGTCGEYNSLVRQLNVNHNIPVPDNLDVSEW